MLIDVRPRIRKPQFGTVEIDWAHPLASKLWAVYVLNEGAGLPKDLTRRLSVGASQNVSWGTTARGPALSMSSTYIQLATDPSLSSPFTTGGASFAFSVLPTAANTDSLFDSAPSAASTLRNYNGGSGAQTTFERQGGAAGGSYAWTANAWHTGVWTIGTPGGSAWIQNLYVNGPLRSTSDTGSGNVAWTTFTIGSLNTTFSFWSGYIEYLWVWFGRVLTTNESVWIQSEPYAFLKPKVSIFYNFPGGTATTPPATTTTRIPSLTLLGVGA